MHCLRPDRFDGDLVVAGRCFIPFVLCRLAPAFLDCCQTRLQVRQLRPPVRRTYVFSLLKGWPRMHSVFLALIDACVYGLRSTFSRGVTASMSVAMKKSPVMATAPE